MRVSQAEDKPNPTEIPVTLITWKEMQRRGRSALREGRRASWARLGEPQGLRLQRPLAGTEDVHALREEKSRPEATLSLVLL